MAQLLIITDKTHRPGANIIGDIVGIFSDEHRFSPDEERLFTIRRVKGTREEVFKKLRLDYPVKRDWKYEFNLSMTDSLETIWPSQ